MQAKSPYQNPLWPDAVWDVSGAFVNDRELIAFYDYCKLLLGFEVFNIVHGSPLCEWNSGRVLKHLMREAEEVRTAGLEYEKRNIAVYLTFTNLMLAGNHLKDAFGNVQRFKGGAPISKAALLSAGGVKAAIDDGLLNVEFAVKSFRIDIFDSMGNDIPEDSNSSEFSQRQKDALRRLQKGKKFFITRVKAVGPDGIERTLSPIEVIVN